MTRPAPQDSHAPPSELAKSFEPAAIEAAWYRHWESCGLFAPRQGVAPAQPGYSIQLPPPNVTGTLHMGHAFNHTLMDVLARWKRMQGADVLWQPGLDHAGIATQMVVERELAREGNAGRREMGREAFVARVWEWKERSGDTILEQCRRLGDSFDLSRNRSRRYCSTTCGNREAVAAYRARQRT